MASLRRLSMRLAGDSGIPSIPPPRSDDKKKRRRSLFFIKAEASPTEYRPSAKDQISTPRHSLVSTLSSKKPSCAVSPTLITTTTPPKHALCCDVVRLVIQHFAETSTLAERTVLLSLNKEIRSLYLSATYKRLSLDITFSQRFFIPLLRAVKLDPLLLYAHTGNAYGRLTPTDMPSVYPYPPAPPPSQTALSRLKARWGKLAFPPTPTEQESSTRRLGGRYRCLLMNTEVLLVRDVVSLKYLATFLLAVLRDLLAIDLPEHDPLSFEFKLLPAMRWVVYTADFATDADITRPTLPAECALHLASRCLFTTHRCVHASPGSNTVFAAKDLLLFPGSRKRFVPTVKHLVLHNVLPREVKHCYVIEHLEMYLSGLRFEWWAADGGAYGHTKWDSREEAEEAWHEASVKDWLMRFFCGGAEGYELEGPMRRYLPAVKLIEFNNTSVDIEKIIRDTCERLYNRGKVDNMLDWKGVIRANKPGARCCEGCGDSA
ncbi:hypothetical protein IAR50_003075 [Cryptococcus sp. DSM 104548]